MTPGIQEMMRQVEKLWDGWRHDVFVARDLDAAMAATAAETSLVNIPAQTGARDRDELRRYLAEDLLPHLPEDLSWRRISRTVDRFRVVDEAVVAFTHDRELPWLLPGISPTHRRTEALTITVVTIQQMRITTQRTLWDHAALPTPPPVTLEPQRGREGGRNSIVAPTCGAGVTRWEGKAS